MQRGDGLQECLAKAEALKDVVHSRWAVLTSLREALPGLEKAVGEVSRLQSSHTQFGEIVLSADQEAVSAAARIIDLFKPIADSELSGLVRRSPPCW